MYFHDYLLHKSLTDWSV